MANMTRLTVVGAGPGGLGFAVNCIRRGISVLVYTHEDHQRTRKAVERRGHLRVEGLITDEVKINFTSNPQEAAGFSEVFVMSIRGDAHADIWHQFYKVDLSSHVILFIPGCCAERRIPENIKFKAIFQTISTPISTLPTEAGIDIVGRKACLTVSGTDESYNDAIEALLGTDVNWAVNELDASTQNPSGVFHPPMMIGNAHRIILGERFRLYREGLTAEVIAMLLEVDKVRCSIRETLGFSQVDAVTILNNAYGTNYKDIEHFGAESPVHGTTWAPASLNHRMLTEDIRIHWVLWYEIGQLLGIDTAALRLGIQAACDLVGENFFKTGLTLDKLKLGKCSPEAFMERFAA
ncbi:hypothetical protein O9K51_09994 [Purpureocillium lavendulum]|uniref:Opine dehydrogenase domain-containing protein n=1 Tax=Purpureocillium lavendulum TaxID=1247861 RepID=A0AB34FDZ1_9HYPO|nr:hypothetical protein O9K51_09994 [Purpureocillium lavendulum]